MSAWKYFSKKRLTKNNSFSPKYRYTLWDQKLMLILAFEILNGVVTSKIALFCLWSNVQTWIYIYYNIFMIWVREEHKLHFSSGLRYATQKPGSVTIHSLNWVLNIFLGWFWVPDQFNHHQQNSLFSNVMHHCTIFKKWV